MDNLNQQEQVPVPASIKKTSYLWIGLVTLLIALVGNYFYWQIKTGNFMIAFMATGFFGVVIIISLLIVWLFSAIFRAGNNHFSKALFFGGICGLLSLLIEIITLLHLSGLITALIALLIFLISIIVPIILLAKIYSISAGKAIGIYVCWGITTAIITGIILMIFLFAGLFSLANFLNNNVKITAPVSQNQTQNTSTAVTPPTTVPFQKISGSGYCELKAFKTMSRPTKNEPNVGQGYAKIAITGISNDASLQASCSDSTFNSLLASYCASNSITADNPVYKSLVIYGSDGEPLLTDTIGSGWPFNRPINSCPAMCTPNWSCTGFSKSNCVSGQQTQTCTDLNNCGTTAGEPALTRVCTVSAPPKTTQTDTLTITRLSTSRTWVGNQIFAYVSNLPVNPSYTYTIIFNGPKSGGVNATLSSDGSYLIFNVPMFPVGDYQINIFVVGPAISSENAVPFTIYTP